MNAKSSTEAELIGVNNAMTQIMWTRYFLEEQKYTVVENIIMQNDVIVMKLEQNGKASSSQKTRHIIIRFFCQRSDRTLRGQYQILPNRSDVGRHTDETSAGCSIPKNEGNVDELLGRLFRIVIRSSYAEYNSHNKNVK